MTNRQPRDRPGHYSRECRKLAYETEHEAKRALRKARGKIGIKGVYECRQCGEWHLTSKR